ncbi:DUF87 domain-containing protein [bacterium D16-51]|nr:DUF87 domain-containing protein [bacterium D16-59]RKI60508.1 DUF87 domain-containing protein [bacterium D16-51]
MLVALGNYKGKQVSFDTETALNQHILILGKSGSGKSVQAQKIITGLSQQEKTVVVFDLHSIASEEQIFPLYREAFTNDAHEVDVYHEGLSCNLFLPLTFSDGETEKQIDTVGAVVDMISRATKLGTGQRAVLRRAVSLVAENGEYDIFGFSAIDRALSGEGTVAAEAVREKLYPLTAHNIFRPGSTFIEMGKINIIRLSKFDLETQGIVAELLLSYFWRVAVTSEFCGQGIFIFLDEFQNLPSGKEGAVSQILSEGRKFNINLILATQQFEAKSASSLHQKLMQCGLILLFHPNTAQAGTLARIIDSGAAKNWTQVLQTLDRGEFISIGPMLLDNILIRKPLRLSSRV